AEQGRARQSKAIPDATRTCRTGEPPPRVGPTADVVPPDHRSPHWRPGWSFRTTPSGVRTIQRPWPPVEPAIRATPSPRSPSVRRSTQCRPPTWDDPTTEMPTPMSSLPDDEPGVL